MGRFSISGAELADYLEARWNGCLFARSVAEDIGSSILIRFSLPEVTRVNVNDLACDDTGSLFLVAEVWESIGERAVGILLVSSDGKQPRRLDRNTRSGKTLRAWLVSVDAPRGTWAFAWIPSLR